MRTHGGIRGAEVAFKQLLKVVRGNGCRTVVIECRYVDADYRSEFAAFWAGRFAEIPAFARRLHFFGSEVREGDLASIPSDANYLGYAVIRPTRFGPLGRTMVAPPHEWVEHVQTRVEDVVNLFGNELRVEAAPFCQQDTEFFTCAQASSWMCHYAAARRNLVPRRLTAEFIEAVPQMLSEDRPLPSLGLNLTQIQAVFVNSGQPALHYGMTRLPDVLGVRTPEAKYARTGPYRVKTLIPPGLWDTRMFSIICRYLNSRFPVLATTTDHTFVIVGWFRDETHPDKPIRFVANDDRLGPYTLIGSPFTHLRAPWLSLMIPLPPKAFVNGENAENETHVTLRHLGRSKAVRPAWRALADGLIGRETHHIRMSLQPSNIYKQRLEDRGLQPLVVAALRLAPMSHYVWVGEARNRAAADAQRPVTAELVFDSTSQSEAPTLLAAVLPGRTTIYPAPPADPIFVASDERLWGSSLPLPADC